MLCLLIENNMDDFKFEIINEIGVLSSTKKGWTLELNRVSWNGKEAKYDIRQWSPDHTKMGRGITLTEEELRGLSKLLNKEIAFLDEEE